MADRLWRAQVSIPLDSGVPEDAIVNTWHFDDDDDPVAAPGDTRDWIMQALRNFYQTIDATLFPRTIGANATVKLYDIAAPMPRQPLFTETLALTPADQDALPSEVALCLSFAAAMESGVPPARRRGRVFIGPLATTVAEQVNSQSRPSTAAMTVLRDAADALQNGVVHPGAGNPYRLRWSIYSPKTDETATVGEAFNDVLSGWVDDAFDTQRRRGPGATSRLVFTS